MKHTFEFSKGVDVKSLKGSVIYDGKNPIPNLDGDHDHMMPTDKSITVILGEDCGVAVTFILSDDGKSITYGMWDDDAGVFYNGAS